jgi:hypothetical protein
MFRSVELVALREWLVEGGFVEARSCGYVNGTTDIRIGDSHFWVGGRCRVGLKDMRISVRYPRSDLTLDVWQFVFDLADPDCFPKVAEAVRESLEKPDEAL